MQLNAQSMIKTLVSVLLAIILAGGGWFLNELWYNQRLNRSLIYEHQRQVVILEAGVKNLGDDFKLAKRTLDSMNVALQIIARSVR